MTFAKYLGVTFLAYALDMGTFLLLSHILGGQYIFANICSKLISAVFGYFLHRHFTFRSTEATGSKQAIGYFSLVAVNIPINTGLFSVLLTLVAPSALAKFIADVACLLMNYWISKVAIFKKGSSVL
ncbi:GtrA family protein [Pseudomonas atacamensis]|uniref:GtrA family protein n=1 Tax=Pseudomonas atacamensis TaxID=2565368 RepID=UPI003207C7B3